MCIPCTKHAQMVGLNRSCIYSQRFYIREKTEIFSNLRWLESVLLRNHIQTSEACIPLELKDYFQTPFENCLKPLKYPFLSNKMPFKRFFKRFSNAFQILFKTYQASFSL